MMKYVAIFAGYIICIISSSSGLKCHECNDVLFDHENATVCSSNPAVQVCNEDEHFCATATFKNDQTFIHCGENDYCIMKACEGTDYCKEEGTFEHQQWYANLSVECCRGEFCNSFSSAHVNKNYFRCYCLYLCLFIIVSYLKQL